MLEAAIRWEGGGGGRARGIQAPLKIFFLTFKLKKKSSVITTATKSCVISSSCRFSRAWQKCYMTSFVNWCTFLSVTHHLRTKMNLQICKFLTLKNKGQRAVYCQSNNRLFCSRQTNHDILLILV